MALSFGLTSTRTNTLSLFLLSSDHIYAYGYNRYGQCGADLKDVHLYAPKPVLLDDDERPVKVVAGFQHGACLCESGRVYAWGKADRGQLGRGDVDMTFKPLLVGEIGAIFGRWIRTRRFAIATFMPVLTQRW